MRESRILMGVIGKPHGVRGLVHVRAYAEDPRSLAAHALHDDHGRIWRLAWRGVGIAQLTTPDGSPLTDRSAAEKLVNLRLYVDRAALPAPAEDEFYLADLIGLAAHDASGALLGHVAAVHDYGAGASLDIAAADGASVLVPFTRAAVPSVDIAAGSLIVLPPAEIIGDAEHMPLVATDAGNKPRHPGVHPSPAGQRTA